jgi:hypothetical protein
LVSLLANIVWIEHRRPHFYPFFELTLPKEHWRDLSEEIELGSEEDSKILGVYRIASRILEPLLKP